MSNNLPYLQIYKGDYLRGNVSACSIAAQGLWLRLMILMHDSERTGYLCLNGEPIPSRIAAIKCAISVDEYETLLAELMFVSAFSTSKEGIIFSPELVAEAEERAKNAERQKRFRQNHKSNGKVTPTVTENKHNSNGVSSSSSSVSKETGGNAAVNNRIWTDGKDLLIQSGIKESTARNLLGKLAKDYGNPLLAECIAVTQAKNPVNAEEFLIACLNTRKNGLSPPINGLPPKYCDLCSKTSGVIETDKGWRQCDHK